MDDYCWIHSTFHVRSEYQGNVGCIVDNTLAGRESIRMAASDTPDTAFYQWVPFTLVFQVSMIEFLRGKVSLGNLLAKKIGTVSNSEQTDGLRFRLLSLYVKLQTSMKKKLLSGLNDNF